MLPKQKEKIPYHFLYFSIGTIFILAGIIFSFLSYNRTDTSQRVHLMNRVNTIAEILPREDLASLSATSDDISNPSYNRLKDIFVNVRKVNKDIRFIYLIGQKDSKELFFYLDSENPESEDYSPPGQSYDEASEDMYLTLNDGVSRSEGPSKDRWGVWFSGYSPVRDSEGKVIAMVGMDIPATEYLLNNFAFATIPFLISFIVLLTMYFLRYAQIKETRYLKMKEEFISIASHEIRTPLVGIRWALEDIFQKDTTQISDDTKSTLDLIYRNCLSLIRETNDLLSINAPDEATKRNLRKEKIYLKGFFEEIQENLILSAREHKVTLTIEPGLKDSDFIISDPKNMHQIFINLMGNAIKYSKPDTEVKISYTKDEKWHTFKVIDHGEGISPENAKRVFEGYFRTEKAIQSKQVGTGLGLYLTKKMIESVGGKIELESVVGSGSTFTVKLPFVIL